MPEATSEQLELIRTPGDFSRNYLAIYKPNVIYTALLNGAPSSTDMVGQISFDGGAGTLANVKAEMTLWVGSSAGKRDLGVCRIRKAPIAGTFYIGFTSEIDWADNCHLTVVDHVRISKKPVLIDDGDVLMDGEHAFTDQHIDFDPVPVLGVHAVGKLEDGSIAFQFDASESWVFGSTITGYEWTAPGSTSIDDDTSATPIITYETAGNHPVYCTVTADNGKSATGVRFAFRFDDENKPHVVEITDDPTSEYDGGGWHFGVKMFADADPTEIIEGALCILFSEDWYGNTKQSVGPIEGRENFLCFGYISEKENIIWDAEASSVEFTVQGPQYWLNKITTNPTGLGIATNTPDEWNVMPALTVDRALWHILHWRSNATVLMDIQLTGDARYTPKMETMEGSLWRQLGEAAWKKIFGRIGCDRFGRFFAVIEPQCVPVEDRTWDTVMTLVKKDWRQRVSTRRISERQLAMLSTSGWLCDATGSVNTLYSLALGHIHADYGDTEIIDQLLVASQAQANEQAGLYMGWINNPFPEFEFDLGQNNRVIDLFPNQFLDVNLLAEDNPRGIAYEGNLIPRSITLRFDSEAGCWDTEIFCEAETFPELAIDGDIPATTGIGDYDFSLPPLPDFPELDLGALGDLVYMPPDVVNANHPKQVVITSNNFGVLYTVDFDAENPTWQTMNNGLSSTEIQEIAQIVVARSGALYIMTGGYSGSGGGWDSIYRASALGATWVKVFSATEYSATAKISGLGVNPLADDQVAIVVGDSYISFGDLDTHNIYVGNNGSFSAGGLARLKFNYYQKGIVFWKNNWIVSGHRPFGIGGSLASSRYWQFDEGGSLVGDQDGVSWGSGAGATVGDAHAISSVNLILWGCNTTSDYSIVEDLEGLSITDVLTGIHVLQVQDMAISPTNVYAMGNDSGVAYKSTDSLATWSAVSGVIPNGSDVWENCGDNNRFLFGGGTVMRLTIDQGATYVNKNGNLGYIAPLIDITGIRFIA
jgi:hypothetical protein